MKTRTPLNPDDFKCPGKGPSLRARWCYTVVKTRGPKDGFVVQVHTRGLLIVGYLSPKCTRATGTGSARKAKVFETAKAANRAAQKCILLTRKPR
jgi:hypothetical protein